MSVASNKVSVAICYSTKCHWYSEANQIAEELLTTFGEELFEVALRPGFERQFDIFVNNDRVSCRKNDGGFPELKVIKQAIRRRINPEAVYGYSDR